MSYQEGTKYKLQADYYESIILECSYVDGTYAYLNNPDKQALYTSYKVSHKTKKLYVFNKYMATWDNIENTLSEYSAEDIWSKRTGNQTCSYDGMNQE